MAPKEKRTTYMLNFKGVSRQDAETILQSEKEFENMMKGEVDNFDAAVQPLLKIMCREIAKQKKRLGGDFAVAHAVVSREVI